MREFSNNKTTFMLSFGELFFALTGMLDVYERMNGKQEGRKMFIHSFTVLWASVVFHPSMWIDNSENFCSVNINIIEEIVNSWWLSFCKIYFMRFFFANFNARLKFFWTTMTPFYSICWIIVILKSITSICGKLILYFISTFIIFLFCKSLKP